MTKKVFFYANRASEGMAALAKSCGGLRIRRTRSKFSPSPSKTLINWGNSSLPTDYSSCNVINKPDAVGLASNKLHFFKHMSEVEDGPRLPPFTTDKKEASKWLMDKNLVCARRKLTGHSAEGLDVLDGESLLHGFEDAPLYTKYVKKQDEYRLHYVFGELVDTQRKARSRDVKDDDVDWRVRNLANGFVYVRGDVNPPSDVIVQAEKAFKNSGLDFGAVDVLYNQNSNKAYVLEINSAPGLTGTTVENYANAIRRNV